MISYHQDIELQKKASLIAERLGFDWIDMTRVVCVRSFGSRSKRILARCHAMSRIMQVALGLDAHYVIETISENFEKLSSEEKTKTIIHELMHIPSTMGGGFRHHRTHVNKRNVEKMYQKLIDTLR